MNPNDTGIIDFSSPENGGEPRDKYIRTFATDMETFHRGGTPGLAPLKTEEPIIVPESIPAPTPVEVPIPVEIPLPEPVAPPMPPVPEIPKEIPPLRHEEPMQIIDLSKEKEPVLDASPAPLKTYLDDFRERVKDTHASTMTILAAEQDAKPREQEEIESSVPVSKNLWYVFGGITLLLVGAAGVYLTYGRYLSSLVPIVVSQTSVAPIFVDSRETLPGTGSVLIQAIKESIGKPLPLNTVRLLSFDSATTSTGIFGALKVSAPGSLSRNTSSSGSVVGVVNTNAGQGLFFILKVSSYSSTFSGMLAWEPLIQRSLGELFPLYSIPVASVSTTTMATTTTATSTAPTATTTTPAPSPKEGFRDEVVDNHDVRVYRDIQGRSILLYGYWNQSTLVIARDPLAFTEILTRLATSHTQP
ncbi:MAG: hypothetical protein NTV60_01610 [Candidatus Kaiserbacteria bacterium]|nr:hypothetical protein [Candidatus Kaiserbacteria bacterium]